MEIEPDVSREMFDQGRRRRFGIYRGEPQEIPFWQHMVRTRRDPWGYREKFDYEFPGEPIWCFCRNGATHTFLNLRSGPCLVSIGGEHEDFYDPDFMIYNDVVIRDLNGGIKIFGFPEDEFPPTDFHTATVVDVDIYIIGGLGYQDARDPMITPVYRLSLDDMIIQKLQTTGDVPGWIYEHQALFLKERTILVAGGSKINYDYQSEPNFHTYEFHVSTLTWHRR
ncbi:MAG: hypothetical protein ABL962_05870 [Fimbriimonadaceae bacterium]